MGVGLLFDGELRFVGDVAIPVNRDVPAVGTVVEVRYLYAFKPGQLYQPVYLSVRGDIREGRVRRVTDEVQEQLGERADMSEVTLQ